MNRFDRIPQRLRLAREELRVRRLRHWALHGTQRLRPRHGRVGLLAGYGNTSYGDYYIGLGLAAAVREIGLEPVIFGRDSHLSAFRDHGIEAHTIDDRGRGLSDFDEFLSTLSAFVVGGGGLFEDRVEATAAQALAAGYAARGLRAATSGVPTAVYGVGIARELFAFRSVNRLLSETLARVDYVGVRDSRSIEAARRLGCTAVQVTDPAVIALGAAARTTSPDSTGTLGLIPFARRAWPDMDPPDEAAHARQLADWESVARRIREIAPQRVRLVPFHRSDLHFLDRITDALDRLCPGVDVERAEFTPDDPLAVLGPLSACDQVLTMRYHGFMASYFAGVRSITGIGESQKLVVTQQLYEDGQLPDAWDQGRAHAAVRACLARLGAD